MGLDEVIATELMHRKVVDHWEFPLSPEVEDTAYSVIMLADSLDDSSRSACRRIIIDGQLEDGSWYNSVDATWICRVALEVLGLGRGTDPLRRAISYLQGIPESNVSIPVRSVVSNVHGLHNPIFPLDPVIESGERFFSSLDQPTSPLIFYTPALAFSLLMAGCTGRIRDTCETLLRRNLSENGSFFGLTRSTVYGGLALRSLKDDRAYFKCCSFLRNEMHRPDGGFQPCRLPVWDTAWAAIALSYAGVTVPSQVMTWLERSQHETGGYAFTSRSKNVPPDIDTSSIVLLALALLGSEDSKTEDVADFLLRNQRKDGSWATWLYSQSYDRGFRYLRDLVAPSDEYADSDVEATAHAIMSLSGVGLEDSKPVRKACEFLIDIQRCDGSWPTSSIVFPEYVTSQCLIALLKAGLVRDQSVVKGINFLVRRQLPNGSWQDSLERTALALWALKQYGKPGSSIDAAESFLRSRYSLSCRESLPYGKTWSERNRVVDEGHIFFFPLLSLAVR